MNKTIEVQYLDWDSRFFGVSVGRIEISANAISSSEDLVESIRRAALDLTYVFLPVSDGRCAELEQPRKALVSLGGRCVDLKTYYRKPCVEVSDRVMTSVSAVDLSDRMFELACESGWCSRFSLDERLKQFQRPMYNLWLRNEFEQGRVLVFPSLDSPLGLVTVTSQGGIARIGLLAVDADNCGRGIGTTLLGDVDTWLLKTGDKECGVVTQGMNVAACRLYEKSGFKLERQVEVWHVWRC